MIIPDYQVQNIIKVYNRQFKNERESIKPELKATSLLINLDDIRDRVAISTASKRKQLMQHVVDKVVKQITINSSTK
ncbi:MAG: hypothetical protein SV062_06110 [Thermodesulfobacteriota bacterium]|nr:hypothetical protein [Thermodesulfobacteriota bacterium]